MRVRESLERHTIRAHAQKPWPLTLSSVLALPESGHGLALCCASEMLYSKEMRTRPRARRALSSAKLLKAWILAYPAARPCCLYRVDDKNSGAVYSSAGLPLLRLLPCKVLPSPEAGPS